MPTMQQELRNTVLDIKGTKISLLLTKPLLRQVWFCSYFLTLDGPLGYFGGGGRVRKVLDGSGKMCSEGDRRTKTLS